MGDVLRYWLSYGRVTGGRRTDVTDVAETRGSGARALEVVAWKRYGHDRLYVNSSDGRRVGWIDRKTGEATLELEELRDAFEATVLAHVPAAVASEATTEPANDPSPPDDPTAQVPPPPPPPPPPGPAPVEEPWTDLALNQPGEAVASEAKKAFADAPVKSVAARVLKVHTQERAWRLGAKGEALVGKQLSKLGPEWRALHSVPIGTRGSDIDHVVMGPGGVYTINAKNHPHKEVWVHGNSIFVNGTRVHYARNSRYEADRAHRILSEAVGFPVPVVGLIAVIGAHEGFTIKSQPKDGRVVVLPRRGLADWLSRRGTVLYPDQLTAIYEAARRSTTWT